MRYSRYFRLDIFGGQQISLQGAVGNRASFGDWKSNSGPPLLPKETDEDPEFGSGDPDNDLGDEPGAAK